jgi:hypothetical protein
MTSHRHLLTVWNSSYSADALDQHLRVLLEMVSHRDAGETDSDDVYVWWGKIRSRNREGPLEHNKSILALDEQVRAGVETHLYLTDYRSLYVGEIGEITDEDVRRADGESGHMPTYYADHTCDCWFRLWDIRRIISDDTPAVIEELKNLQNTAYYDRPVSLYGGIVDLPLIVKREPDAAWFSDRDSLIEGRLWAESAAALRSDISRTSHQLRDNLFGRDIWVRLGPSTRAFLSTGETIFRARRDDPGFDASGAALEFAKAVESELNGLVFRAVRRAVRNKPMPDRTVRTDKGPLDLSQPVPHQTLGALWTLLKHDEIVQAGLRQQLPHDHGWVLGPMMTDIKKLADLRNDGAHTITIPAAALEKTRERILGIGCEGVIPRLALVRIRLVS